jgi:hypothetical protein
MRPREKCESCGVFHSNGSNHLCVEYDASHPCETCGAATVFVMISAPGAGQGRECVNGHYHGTWSELTLDDVR